MVPVLMSWATTGAKHQLYILTQKEGENKARHIYDLWNLNYENH